ncbi:MAG: autotransporter outer membrane beta-barrel domain-containing protein [Pseudomonadota bacterium]
MIANAATFTNNGTVLNFDAGTGEAGGIALGSFTPTTGATTLINNGRITLQGANVNNANVRSAVSMFGINGQLSDYRIINGASGVIEDLTGGNIAIESSSSTFTAHRVTLTNAGVIRGDIRTQGGADRLSFTGGSVTGSVSTFGGNDRLDWSGGTFVGDVDLGLGSDVMTISSSSYTGANVLDGGDDLSTADGAIDSLTLSGVNATLAATDILNWENVEISASNISVSNGTMAVGTVGQATTGLTLSNNTRFRPTGNFALAGNLLTTTGGRFVGHGSGANPYSISGALTNDGEIDVSDGNVGDTVSVAGNYNGSGALRLDTELGDDGSPTDQLVIAGDASGNTALFVRNAGGAVAVTDRGVKVVDVAGTSTSDAFRLGAPAEGGAFIYNLEFEGSDQDWYLRSTGEIGTVGVAYESALHVLGTRLPTLEQRVGQRIWGQGKEDSELDGAWLRVTGAYSEITPENSTSQTTIDRRIWALMRRLPKTLVRCRLRMAAVKSMQLPLVLV